MLSLPTEYQSSFALIILLVVMVLLLWDRFKASTVFLGAAILLLLSGILSAQEFLQSFSNTSIVSIFLLIFISSVFQKSFNIIGLLERAFGTGTKPRFFILKMSGAVAALSSIMNNTPIVAFMIPFVYNWSKKHKVSPAKLLLPLSFAAIVGGMITLIGTSTNLVLNGFLEANGEPTFELSDFIVPGILVSIGCILYLSTIGYSLLPDRKDISDEIQENVREFLVELEIDPSAEWSGDTVSEAGLRNLDSLYLVEVLRDGKRIFPVMPEERLFSGDRLFFAGDTSKAAALVRSRKALTWSKAARFGLENANELVEVVVPFNSSLTDQTVKDFSFRDRFNAAVVAVHRNGVQLEGKIGEIKLKVGDMMLLVAGSQFNSLIRQSKDIYVISRAAQNHVELTTNKKLFLASTALVVFSMLFGLLTFFQGLLLILGASFGFKLFNFKDLKKGLNIDLLFILSSAISLGLALIATGASEVLASWFLTLFANTTPFVLLVGIYFLTILFTTFVTNVAAVSIVFPLVYSIVQGVPEAGSWVFYMAVAFGASAAFLTPVSYQTNLMVYAPGNYKQKDFLKVGAPMLLVYSSIILSYLYMQLAI